MPAAVATEQIIFPPFRLDLGAGCLWSGLERIDLPPKAYAVLCYLAGRPGQLVSKEELLGTIWRDVYVGDSVLKGAVAEIRKALSDSCQEPRFVETAHRRGYRFVAKLETAARSAFSESASSKEAIPLPPKEIPPTHYAHSGDINIAYQVLGEGSLDLVFVMGWVSHLEYFWTEPSFARFLRRLASFSRLILFDKRGTGLSDRVPITALPTLEQRMHDVKAVMEAAGSRRAALCGVSEGAVMAALFAATYPKKTSALVMIGPYAKRIRDATYPWGPTEAERESFLQEIRQDWGGPVGLEERAPSVASDPRFREWWATYLRMAASPGAAVALTTMNSQIDIRGILPSIRVPTLVIHRTGDACLRVEEGRYVASRIPGARFVELPGVDHLPFVGDQDAVLDETEEFLTGARHAFSSDGVLATVLAVSFASVAREPELSADAWQRFHNHIEREVQWFKGQEFARDRRSLLASFDGPARAIRCACAIVRHASKLSIQSKAGLHIGECRSAEQKLQGAAVECASNIEAEAAPGEILVSGTIRDLVAGSGIQFERRGFLRTPCLSERLPLFSVDSGSPR